MPRQWQRFLGADLANLADHHFRVIWIALMIAAHEQPADSAKIIKMALVHDITESRTGDVDYLSRQYVDRNEELGIKDMLCDTPLAKEFTDLWHEYEARSSKEAKIVKDADNLDVDLELREQVAYGHVLESTFKDNRKIISESRLYTKTAKKYYRKIKTSNPHNWHTTSPRNRVNGGDWLSKTPKKSK